MDSLLHCRVRSIPSEIAFQFSLFPDNLPMPAQKKSAWIIGSTMHLLHFIVRVSQIRKISAVEPEWGDLYNEGDPWFDWV
jgi:hypothetical protein